MKKSTFRKAILIAVVAMISPVFMVAQEVEQTPFDTLATSVSKVQ